MENKTKTPCEKLGYKVGDKFEVMGGHTFSKGSIVELSEDDGTDLPAFILVSGEKLIRREVQKGFTYPENVKKIDGKGMKPESEIQDTVWLQLASLERFARSCNYTYSQGGFYYFGNGNNGEDRVSLELIQTLHNKYTRNKIVEKAYLQYNKKQRKLQATKHIVKLV